MWVSWLVPSHYALRLSITGPEVFLDVSRLRSALVDGRAAILSWTKGNRHSGMLGVLGRRRSERISCGDASRPGRGDHQRINFPVYRIGDLLHCGDSRPPRCAYPGLAGNLERDVRRPSFEWLAGGGSGGARLVSGRRPIRQDRDYVPARGGRFPGFCGTVPREARLRTCSWLPGLSLLWN